VSSPRLTSLSHGAGCACKLPAADVHTLLSGLPRPAEGAVLVGLDAADDAAVYRVSPELAIVSTADFFTPIVDDPHDFGLLGHLRELAEGSGVSAEVEADAVPAIGGVLDLLSGPEPPISGGSRRNRTWAEEVVTWGPGVPEERRRLLCDAMTSGGLLVAAPPRAGALGARIGRLVEGAAGRISVS
jgi:selenophosphate synthase